MMTKNILFIGAGASYGARPSGPELPLGLNLCGWLRKYIPTLLGSYYLVEHHYVLKSAWDSLEQFNSECNFEVFVSKLKQEQRLSMQKTLQICFTDLSKQKFDLGFNTRPDGYDQLIQKLQISGPEWSIISLNYDRLIEEALNRCQVNFHFPYFPYAVGTESTDLSSLKFYKPHGSINFFAHTNYNVTFGKPAELEDLAEATHFTNNLLGESIPNHPNVYAGLHGPQNVLGRLGSVDQVMANYTKGKESDVNQITLEKIRKEAICTAKNAEKIVIIGVKPISDKADDPFVSELFSIGHTDCIYVTKAAADSDFMRKINPNVKIYENGLINFLED